MAKNNKNKSKNKKRANSTLKYLGIGLICVGFLAILFGASKWIFLDVNYDGAKIACDDKDYSSYVKYTENTVPGNESINSQIDVVKRAMDAAKAAGDYASYGRLWEEYNRLLDMQSQTSTSVRSYDYSEADKAKEKCYSLAEKQKETDGIVGIVSAVLGVLAAGVGVYFCKK